MIEMSEMSREMCRALNKNIKVTCVDGEVIQGYCCDFTQALDNEPEVASLGIRRGIKPGGGIIEIFEPEIAEIEVLQD